MLIASDLRRGPNRSFGAPAAAVAPVAASDGDSVVSWSKIRLPLSKVAGPALRLEFSSINTIPGYSIWRKIPGQFVRHVPGSKCQVCPRSVPPPPPPPPPARGLFTPWLLPPPPYPGFLNLKPGKRHPAATPRKMSCETVELGTDSQSTTYSAKPHRITVSVFL